MKQNILFANVDLEIKSKDDLQCLIDSFGKDIDVLYHERLENGLDFVSLEFHLNKVESGIYGSADETINAFYSKIVNFPPESRKIWDRCLEKKFDIGFESGNSGETFNTNIKSETIKQIAEIGASIVITIYPFRNYAIHQNEE